MPGLKDAGQGLVGTHFDPPGVRADAGDLLFVDPVDGFEGEARRIAGGVGAPLALIQAVGHLAGVDDHEVAPAHLDALFPGGRVEIADGNAVAVGEALLALVAGNVQQHAAADHLVGEMLDPVLVGAS